MYRCLGVNVQEYGFKQGVHGLLRLHRWSKARFLMWDDEAYELRKRYKMGSLAMPAVSTCKCGATKVEWCPWD